MGRLIDADALSEEIKSLQVFVAGLRAGKGILNEYAKMYRESVLRIVDEQPTAYDVEKVAEQLEKASTVYDFCELAIREDIALHIVRVGGELN